jgi:phosphohistidine swiveling domain-containing protein
MTGLELDRRLREILSTVTKETSFTSTAAIAALGFGVKQSFEIVCATLLAKEKHSCRKSPKKRSGIN